jgi:hypothetical protein
MLYRSPSLTEPVRGIVTMLWGSTFPSSGHWALATGRAMMERCARTAGCRASRECSRTCSRRRAGAAPGPTSLACGLRKQAVGPRRAGHAPRELGHEGRCRPGPRADFSLVAREFKKFIFYFSFGFKLNSNFKILYLNIQNSKNYEISSVGFIIF